MGYYLGFMIVLEGILIVYWRQRAYKMEKDMHLLIMRYENKGMCIYRRDYRCDLNYDCDGCWETTYDH